MELVSIAASDGSTPRGAGAMMAVFPGGGITGTIGGGNVEFECQRLAAELDELRKMAREPKAELDKLLAPFRARDRAWAGIRADLAGKLRGLHKDKVRLKRTVDSLESENGKLREALEKWKTCH